MTNEEKQHGGGTPQRPPMSAVDFARLGDGHIAYVKQVETTEAARMFPGLRGVPEGIDLYALVSADGTPLSLRDTRDSAIADAIENNLQTVSVH